MDLDFRPLLWAALILGFIAGITAGALIVWLVVA